MGNYEQLELFDLPPYTSKQTTAINVEGKQVDETQKRIEYKYKQLELDLFPEASHKTHKELVK